jgi:hypothetical protein
MRGGVERLDAITLRVAESGPPRAASRGEVDEIIAGGDLVVW